MTASRRAYRPRISVEDAVTCCALAEPGAVAFLDFLVEDAGILVPNPPVDIVQWAFDNVIIPFSVSPERPGNLVFNPVQAAIIRKTQSPTTKQVSFRKPPRFGSSLMSVAILLYATFHEGRSVIYYERSEDTAQKFHDAFIVPIIENSPELLKLMRPRTKAGVQDSWSDIILTNGAILQFRSASNNGHMRSIKGNPVIGDEVSSKEWKDRSKHSEGSKVRLLRTRLQQSARPMLYVGSTPTNAGDCIVSQEYERSDQQVYRMPCPRCSTPMAFEASPAHFARVESRDARRGPGLRYTVNGLGRPDDAWYECECGGLIEETEKIEMMEAGSFVVLNPLGEEDHEGVQSNALYSTDPQSAWLLLAKEHVEAIANPAEMMPGFVNHICALPYDAAPERVADPSSLASRTEVWKLADGSRAQAPRWTRMVVKGVDVQRGHSGDSRRPGRFEVTTVAVGTNRRRAVIDHVIVSHEEVVDTYTGEITRVPLEPFIDGRSEELLWAEVGKSYTTEDGRELKARRTFVDVSWRTDEAVKYCHLPRSRALGIVPMRGSTIERNGARVPILPDRMRLPKGRETGRRYFFIGAQSVKDRLTKLLRIPVGYVDSYVFADHLDASYFEGLVAEFPDEIRPGAYHWSRISESNTGEPWDCLVYAYAAERYEIAKMGRKSKLAQEIDAVDPHLEEKQLAERAEEIVSEDAPTDPPPLTAFHAAEVADDNPEPIEPASRFRVVQRKVRREPERNTDGVSERVRRVRARKTGLGW